MTSKIVWYPLRLTNAGIMADGIPSHSPTYREDIYWVTESDLDTLLNKHDTYGIEAAKEYVRHIGRTFAAKTIAD